MIRIVADPTDQCTVLPRGIVFEVIEMTQSGYRIQVRPGLAPVSVNRLGTTLVENAIPRGWQYTTHQLRDSVTWSIGPRQFATRGFWEDVHDGRSEAMEIWNCWIAGRDRPLQEELSGGDPLEPLPDC